MWEQIKNAILKLFGKTPNKTNDEARGHTEDARAYEDTAKTNIVAIVANKLSTLTVTESMPRVVGDSQRSELLNNLLYDAWDNAHEVVSRAFGTGGVGIIPYVACGKIYTDIIPRDRFIINQSQGTDLTSVTVVADVIVRNNQKYARYTDYTLEGGDCIIRNRATIDGMPASLSVILEWINIPDEVRVGNVDRLPLAYLRCPVNHGRTDNLYGVPITRGSEDLIRQIGECLNQIQQEYKDKKSIIFADGTLFDKNDNISATLFKKTLGGGSLEGKSFYEVFDPDFRDTSYYNRLDHLFALLEKSVGCSRGVLTEPQSFGATATEIKRGSYDTFALITSMRRQIEAAVDDLVYAFNVYANAFSLSPLGDYVVSWDWSDSLVESSSETWQQMLQAKSAGALETVDLRQFIYPNETREEAQEAVERISENEPSLSSLIGE